MHLSKRLEAIKELILPTDSIVDVGTDHAFLPIDLIQNRDIAYALACDVANGPLQSAKEHILQYGLQEQIQTFLSDGLREVASGAAETVVMAGMGGKLMVSLLEYDREKSASFSRWVLQPQSDVDEVRRYLYHSGRYIAKERFLVEDGKWYVAFLALPGEKASPSEVELAFGPMLLKEKHMLLYTYLLRQKEIYDHLLADLSDRSGERIQKRRKELARERDLVMEAIQYYEPA